ncbi:D-aminoacyl-tRNA deacylase [Mesonia maritima]|uniref:D-aminoacyl-tRNA deacylase n=1 Tax=Mesonia maritima TaxID=1793873 RepID=A0ABU1K921_9FLAO|nr:D-aminoacyl-tRNA deacylase [Mesonia maritima]MDR6302099.1 D-tyrosyl-tRNA(Tyr) deacylase [Mesonia maritima]
MRVIIQRVSKAEVKISAQTSGKINKGLLVLIGIEPEDSSEDISYLCRKITTMRIFSDENGAMNLSLKDIDGEALLISQFTLHANTKKGNRPSFIRAAKPETAIPLYENFIQEFENYLEKKVQTGEFGADMQVSLINDGPVTIFMDSKERSF